MSIMRRLAILLAFGGAAVAIGLAALGAARPATADVRAGDSPSGIVGGVEVRGEWHIEVRDADGNFVEERRFTNHLKASGATLLSGLLRGDLVAGVWNVQLWSVGDEAQLCFISPANETPTACNLHTPSFTPLPGSSPTLDVEYGTVAFDGALVLEGTLTADRDGELTRVVTQAFPCSSDTSPAACRDDLARSTRSGRDADFTETTIETLAVKADQQVSVTVVISFS